MQYWRSVLNEVIYKNDSNEFLFTHNEQLDDNDSNDFLISDDLLIKAKETRDLRMYYLGSKFPDVHLTKREAECMFWMVQDNTISQTADIMELSARTVEFYVKNLKLKLHCKNKKELLAKILRSSLLQQLEKEGLRLIKH